MSYVANHSKQRRTTKVIKLQWIVSISCQNDRNNAKVRRRSNYNELIDLTSKRSKMLSYVANHSEQRRTTKVIKLQWICIDLTSKRSRMLSYVANHSKQRRTTNVIKLQWIASITCQNIKRTQKYECDQIIMKWFDVKTIKNVELRRKPFKTTQNYKCNQITMNCIDYMSKHQKNAKVRRRSNYNELIDLTSKRSKMLSYVANHSKQRRTTKLIKLQWIVSISCQNDRNNAKVRRRSNYNELIDLTSKRSKMLSYVAKHSKQRRTTKVIKLQWIVSISCQNDRNNAKVRRRSNKDEFHRFDVKTIKNVELRRKPFKTTQNYKSNQITMNLHRFDVKTIKNVELRRKPFKTTQNYKSNQITMNCIDFMSKTSKGRKTTNAIK